MLICSIPKYEKESETRDSGLLQGEEIESFDDLEGLIG